MLSEFAPNVAFDRNAFLLACRTPAMPKGGDTADDVMNVTDPVSGITFQIALYRQYRQVRYEVGVAWGLHLFKKSIPQSSWANRRGFGPFVIQEAQWPD